MTVNFKEEAWNLASRLFPTDYDYDLTRTRNAGYPIYFSTKDGVNAWISDLGNRLELNYPNGSSENIWIKENKKSKDISEDIKERNITITITININK